MIHLTIDGIPVEVEKGTTILQAARQIGVEIPTLCYLEDVLPDGSCRLCVVEVTNNGRTKFDTACTLRCSEGDEVQTMSEKVVAYRKDTLDLLLSETEQSSRAAFLRAVAYIPDVELVEHVVLDPIQRDVHHLLRRQTVREESRHIREPRRVLLELRYRVLVRHRQKRDEHSASGKIGIVPIDKHAQRA